MSRIAEDILIAFHSRVHQIEVSIQDMRVACYEGPAPKFLPVVPKELYPKILILSSGTWSEALSDHTAHQRYDMLKRTYMGLKVIVSPEIPSGEVLIL